MLVSLSHHKVESLVFLTRHQTVVKDLFLVVRHRTIRIDGVSREGQDMCGIAWRLGPLASHGVVRRRFAKSEGQKRSSGTPDV